MKKKIINMAVVGCGYWGPNLIRNFRGTAGAKVKVICDKDVERLSKLKSLYPEVQTETEFENVINDKTIEAVVIATPVRFHFKMAKAALEAGKHTFIEKPMAASSAECSALIEIAEKNRLTLMVGHTFLYSSPVRKIKEIIQSGDIGQIQYISSRRLNLGLYQKDINVAWDLAPHDISIVLYIMEESPMSVNCRGNCHVTPGIEDVTNMALTFRHNQLATIQNSWLDPRKVREMTIVGTRRMIVYDDLEPLEKIKIYDARVDRPPHYNTFAEFTYSYHYGDIYIPYVKQEEPLKVECQHFIDCINTGAAPITDGRHGLELVKILEASSESLKQNGSAIYIDAPEIVEHKPVIQIRTGNRIPNGNGNGISDGRIVGVKSNGKRPANNAAKI
ncbi:MAG: Gfo/Idh/MocA family protein [Verrucomicrobiota bacterium]